MIKINLDSTPKDEMKHIMKGSVEVSGNLPTLAQEIYTILKDFEEVIPDALEIALDRLINKIFDELEEE